MIIDFDRDPATTSSSSAPPLLPADELPARSTSPPRSLAATLDRPSRSPCSTRTAPSAPFDLRRAAQPGRRRDRDASPRRRGDARPTRRRRASDLRARSRRRVRRAAAPPRRRARRALRRTTSTRSSRRRWSTTAHFEVAKASSSAARCTRRREAAAPADPPPHPPQQPGRRRGAEGRDRRPQDVPLARRDPAPPSPSPRGHRARARSLGHRVRPHRGGPGHGAGGAHEAGHCGRRGLHPLPRRARDAARRRSAPRRASARRSPADPGARGGRHRATLWDGADLRKRIEFAASASTSASRPTRSSRAPPLRPTRISRGPRPTIILNSKTLIERDADFAPFAGRIQLTYIYEETSAGTSCATASASSKDAHRARFRKTLEHGVAIKRLNPRCSSTTSTKLAAALDPSADLEFDFLGIQTLYDRYLIIDKTGKPAAPPRDAAVLLDARRHGLSASTRPGDREARVAASTISTRPAASARRTPTLFNSGTLHSQLSSCYLYYVDDSIEGIMHRGIAENAYLSKWAGGLGGSWTAVRGTGAYIDGTNGESPGRHPVPEAPQRPARRRQPGRQAQGLRLRLPRDLAQRHRRVPRAAQEHRRRPPPHARHEHGELDSRPVHEAHGGPRAPGRSSAPTRCPDLHELYGEKFEERYVALRAARRGGQDPRPEDRGARALEEDALDALRDRPPVDHLQGPCNVRSPQDHVGVIHSSQSLHRDHAQHRATTRPPSATSARSSSTRT